MIENEDEIFDIGLRQHSLDKVTYKNILAVRVNSCLATYGTFSFQYNVKRLEKSIYFDVTGYRLKPEIENIKNEVDSAILIWEEEQKEKLGKNFYKRANKGKFNIKRANIYWETLFDELYQLLAENKLLVETQRVIPLRVKKLEQVDDYEPEGSIEDIYE